MIDPRPRKLLPSLLISGVLLLTVAVWLLVRHHAYHEPHYSFRGSDVLLYVGMNFVLMTLAAELAALIVLGMVTRRLGWWWTVAVLWLSLVFLLSMAGAHKWIGDQEWRRIIDERRSLGP